MVSAGVSWAGKTNIQFIDTNKAKVNSKSYIQLLDNNLLPDCGQLHPGNHYVFQKDGAPSHTSRETQNHLEEVTPAFIKKMNSLRKVLTATLRIMPYGTL